MKFAPNALILVAGLGQVWGSSSTNLRAGDARDLQADEELEGIFVLEETQFADHHEEEATWNLELLSDGQIYRLDGVPPEFAAENRSQMASGVTKIKVSGLLKNGKIQVSGKPTITGKAADAPGQNTRRLALTGNKSVLAVRILLSDDQYNFAASHLSNKVFGTSGDATNLKSQYAACSHNQFTLTPAVDRTCSVSVTGSTVSNIVNGVITVEKPNDSVASYGGTGGSSSVRSAATSAIQTACGTSSIRNIADHVMFCVPDSSMTGIAYAGVNSWYSVYADDWCNYPSVQLHEIGHNLNLAHSGETDTYDDKSGFMGYSYSQDEQKMCFNNAKNWQLGWFDGAKVDLTDGQSYSGPLKGQVNYVSGGDPVLIKIDAPSSTTDYYVGFNHRVKHNINTAEGGNQVTIQSRGNNGSGYGTSKLLAKLNSGGSWSVPLSNGKDAVVTVNSITTGENDGAAQVSIMVGATPAPVPTPAPVTAPPVTAAPVTPGPTGAPATPGPTGAPATAAPATPGPTGAPVTAAPVTPGPTGAPVPPTPAPTPAPFNYATCCSAENKKGSCQNKLCSGAYACQWTTTGSGKNKVSSCVPKEGVAGAAVAGGKLSGETCSGHTDCASNLCKGGGVCK